MRVRAAGKERPELGVDPGRITEAKPDDFGIFGAGQDAFRLLKD